MVSRRISLTLLTAACLSGMSGFSAEHVRPNIIFILADDLGWTDLGCVGSKYYETPHLDRLASQGVTLTSFCVSQNCAPTRACLMSGQFAPRTGIYTVGSLERSRDEDRAMSVPHNETQLPLEKITVAERLRGSGYATAMFGKWHLGGPGKYHPSRRGFEEAVVAQGRHFEFETSPTRDVPKGVYLADYLTDQAVRFIDANKSRPFFLYLPHFAVHSPYQAKESWTRHFAGKPSSGGHSNPTYAAMIASVDESVGRILSKLDELKLASRTVVVFASDNGGVGGYERTEPPSRKRGVTDNAPLRGGKGTLYEGGLRVPLIARWPDHFPAGVTCDQVAAHVDLYPTFLEWAGVEPPKDYPLDGVSLASLLEHPERPFEHPPIFWHFPGYLESYVHERGWRTEPVGVIRAGDWKLMEFFTDGHMEMYNLRQDIGEADDMAPRMRGKAMELRAALAAWRESVGAPMPRPK